MLEGPFFLGSDHAGFALKNFLRDQLIALGLEVEDCGPHSAESCDYPETARRVCELVLDRKGYGILVCGTGIGMSIAANKVKGIRAACCTDCYSAKMTREHNDANILCLGGRVLGVGTALMLADVFLDTPFCGEERHKRRIAQME